MPRIKYENKEGQRLQGITTVKGQQLGWGKQPLMIWANKQGLEGKTLNEARDTATIPGTIAHYLIESDLNNIPQAEIDSHITNNLDWKMDDIEKAFQSFKNFASWCEQFKFKPIEVEPHLESEEYQLGGTPDVIAEVMGKLSIIDWKTGRTYEDLFLQLQAYKLFWEENHPEMPITGGFHVLRIPKNEDIPSFHHSHWATLPPEATEAIKAILKLKQCQGVLKKLL